MKRTLYFGNEAYLFTLDNQLILEYPSTREQKKVPIEDIGVVILDHYQISISLPLIQKLLENNVAFISCNQKHMPTGLLLNLDGNQTQQEHFRVQLQASEPLKKALWKQTIEAKIKNQAAVLKENEKPYELLVRYAKSVKSGDSENLEARAAAHYWKHLFSDSIEHFKRGRYEDAPNHLLNYAYAIVRAIVARSLVASGLLPTLGYHHRNKYNAYALADDVMEPYRPYVDQVVLEMVEAGYWDEELTPRTKKSLLMIPQMDVQINGKTHVMMVAIQKTTASLYQCYSGEKKKILFPEL